MNTTIEAAPTTIDNLTARNASLAQLVELLGDQHTRRRDIVVPAKAIRADGGRLLVDGQGKTEITMDGVTTHPGIYTPTEVCDEGLSAKLDIPLRYLRRMRAENIGLYDTNLNAWLSADDRTFMLRCLTDGDGNGIARALLSDRYMIVDNLDVLMAALAGIQRAGMAVEIEGCDLTERRMYVRVRCDGVKVLAPALLAGYRSPFTGRTGADNPVVSAGFTLSNSEVGNGALSITPRLVVEVCSNGMTVTRDAMRSVHLGGRQDEGLIEWSEQTQKTALDLVTAKTTDAVKAFLSPEYATRVLRQIEAEASKPITDPTATIDTVGKQLKFNEDQRTAILSHFIAGADLSAGGVLHAVTSVARTLRNADDAYALEAKGLDAMRIAATM